MNAARKAGEDGHRNIVLRFVVNPKEHKEIEKFVEIYGCTTISEYLRQVALCYRKAERKQLEESATEQ